MTDPGTRPGTILIIIDPKFPYPGYPKDKPNPAEIADTILHELMHASIIAYQEEMRRLRERNPLPPGGTDAYHDPRLRELRERHPLPFPIDGNYGDRMKEYLDKNYGAEPIYPDKMYSDINRQLQERLIEEMRRIREQAGVGGPTLTESGTRR